MAFDLTTRLLLTLGNTIRDIDGTGTYKFVLRDWTPESITYIEELLAKIDTIDVLYDTALEDSMAVRVDTLHLDYSKHLALLAARGNSYLERLSAFSKIPIVYNRFTGSTTARGGDNTSKGNPPVSVRSCY